VDVSNNLVLLCAASALLAWAVAPWVLRRLGARDLADRVERSAETSEALMLLVLRGVTKLIEALIKTMSPKSPFVSPLAELILDGVELLSQLIRSRSTHVREVVPGVWASIRWSMTSQCYTATVDRDGRRVEVARGATIDEAADAASRAVQ